MGENVSREEFEQLKTMVLNLISSINKKEGYDKAEKDGIRQAEGTQRESIDQNTADIDYIKIMEDL